jgi:hypothetical protein
MAGIGIAQPSRLGYASGPPNRSAPAPGGGARSPDSVAFWESGPFWVLVFLVVGYVLVFQTLK